MGFPRLRRFALLGLVGCVLSVACAQSSPSAPSGTPQSALPVDPGITLTVRVLQRTTELPIPGARVETSLGTGSTDASGLFVLVAVAGRTTDVDVSAPGYESMGASGVLADSERWTFYLASSGAGSRANEKSAMERATIR